MPRSRTRSKYGNRNRNRNRGTRMRAGFNAHSNNNASKNHSVRGVSSGDYAALNGNHGHGPYHPVSGGRRRSGLSRKNSKKVKRCLKKASGKKTPRARRTATKKCMRLKKRLSKH